MLLLYHDLFDFHCYNDLWMIPCDCDSYQTVHCHCSSWEILHNGDVLHCEEMVMMMSPRWERLTMMMTMIDGWVVIVFSLRRVLAFWMVSIVHLVLVHTSLSVVAIDDTIGVDVIQLCCYCWCSGVVCYFWERKKIEGWFVCVFYEVVESCDYLFVCCSVCIRGEKVVFSFCGFVWKGWRFSSYIEIEMIVVAWVCVVVRL